MKVSANFKKITGKEPEDQTERLLENGADVHAETDYWGGETMPIHEFCAQELQRFETEYERGTGYSLDKMEKLREINKLVMDKKEKTTI